MKHRKMMATLPAMLLALTSLAMAADPDVNILKNSGSLDRLAKQSGVYNASSTGKTPGFVADPAWPQPLPHNWLVGQLGGLYVDQHDHIWVYNRPRTMTNEEAGLEGAVPGATNEKGQPIDGIGQPRVVWPHRGLLQSRSFHSGVRRRRQAAEAPGAVRRIPVSSAANVKRTRAASGRRASTEFMSTRRTTSGSPEIPEFPARQSMPWSTNKAGGDGLVLKFDMDGNFKMRIGGTPKGPDSNDMNGGINGTPLLFQATDMVVDPATNRLYVSDGYGNRHVLIVDANTGKYIGHFGAYGNNPVDDAGAKAAGTWIQDDAKGNRKPAFFRNPVHCVKLSPMTARFMSATAATIAFRCSTRTVPNWASRAAIRPASPANAASSPSNLSASTPTRRFPGPPSP